MWLQHLADYGIPLAAGIYCAAIGRDAIAMWEGRLPKFTRRLVGVLGVALVVVTLMRMALAYYLTQR